VDHSNEKLLVSVQNGNEYAVYVFTHQLEDIKSMLVKVPIITAKWSIFNKNVFIILYKDNLKLYRLTDDELECKEMNMKTFGAYFNNYHYSSVTESFVGAKTQSASHLIFCGTSEGTVHV